MHFASECCSRNYWQQRKFSVDLLVDGADPKKVFHDYVGSSEEYEVWCDCMVGESGEEANAPPLTATKQEVRCYYASSKAS